MKTFTIQQGSPNMNVNDRSADLTLTERTRIATELRRTCQRSKACATVYAFYAGLLSLQAHWRMLSEKAVVRHLATNRHRFPASTVRAAVRRLYDRGALVRRGFTRDGSPIYAGIFEDSQAENDKSLYS